MFLMCMLSCQGIEMLRKGYCDFYSVSPHSFTILQTPYQESISYLMTVWTEKKGLICSIYNHSFAASIAFRSGSLQKGFSNNHIKNINHQILSHLWTEAFRWINRQRSAIYYNIRRKINTFNSTSICWAALTWGKALTINKAFRWIDSDWQCNRWC